MCTCTRSNRCVIISASPEFFLPDLRGDDYIIACDGGLKHAMEHGIRPQLVVGDFDSYEGELDGSFNVFKAPCEKDDTDTMLAIKLALKDGYRNFMLLGATGGRLDHLLANISAGVYIANHGGNCIICDKSCKLHVIKDTKLVLHGLTGQTLSVFSYTDESQGVTLCGMKYPLKDGTITNTFPIGVSNLVTSESCSVEVKNGILLVIESGMVH